MDLIMKLAEKHDIFVLEDNAQCFLGTYKGQIVGTIGHAASFSFQSSKHVTSGEGGMVITNDLALAEGIRKVQSLGYVGVSASKGKLTAELMMLWVRREVSIKNMESPRMIWPSTGVRRLASMTSHAGWKRNATAITA